MSNFADLARTDDFTKNSKALEEDGGASWRKLLTSAALAAALLVVAYGTYRVEASHAAIPPANPAVPVTVETAAPPACPHLVGVFRSPHRRRLRRDPSAGQRTHHRDPFH